MLRFKKKTKIQKNDLFNKLMEEYSLPADFSFSIQIPREIRKILESRIIISDLGISLEGLGKLYAMREKHETKTIIEDSQNHFHVDWFIKNPNDKKVFMLGVKTLVLLAQKFENNNIKGVRFWYSFQTPELAKLFDKSLKIKDDETHYISDRLSFYTRRKGEEIISIKNFKKSFWAILIIDI